MFIHSAGFYSYFHIHLPGSFPIVDTHPDSTATTDLRLLTPWPELSSFAQEMTAKIDELDAHTHGHIPYVVLLLHYLEQWKKNHAGNPPQTYAEKTAFRKMVAKGARTNNPEGGEENYDEAVAAVLKTVIVPSLSVSVREVFDYNPDEAS
jgi:amyloid beta precursor protein binding protein 1